MTAAWRTGFYRQRQGRELSSTPFHRSSPSVISRLIKAGKLLSSTRPCRIIRAMPSVSRTATSVKPSTQGWSRTNDVRFRKPALYPLSYKGVCLRSARTPATCLPDWSHSHQPFATYHCCGAMAFSNGMMVFYAHSTRTLLIARPIRRAAGLHSRFPAVTPTAVVPPVGLEPTTHDLKGRCSNH